MAVDKGYAWIIMMANFGLIFVNSGLVLTTGIMLLTVKERFQEDATKSALVTSFYTSLVSLAGPFGSIIVQKVSCRVAVVTGSLLMTSGFLITAFSNQLILCIFSCGIIAGVGSGISMSVLFIINGFNFQSKLYIANGVSFAGAGVGLFALAPLFEKAKELFGYPGVFVLAASVSFQSMVFGVLMRPSRLEMEAKKNKGNTELTPKGTNRAYLRLFCDKAIFLLVLSFALYLGSYDTIYMYWPSLLKENGFNQSQTSLFLSISGISAIVGRLIIGYVSSHFPFDILYLYSLSLTALGILCINFKFYGPSTIGQIINAVLIGICTGVPLVIFTATTIRCVGVKYLSAVGGLQLMSAGIGSLVIPLICGFVVSRGFEYADALMICGGCYILAAILVIGLKFSRKGLVEVEDN